VTREEMTVWLARSCALSSVPMTVDDPEVLRRVGAIIAAHGRSKAKKKPPRT